MNINQKFKTNHCDAEFDLVAYAYRVYEFLLGKKEVCRGKMTHVYNKNCCINRNIISNNETKTIKKKLD